MTNQDSEIATTAMVFDFGGVLFNWQPPVLIQSLMPDLALDIQQAEAIAALVFQSFGPGSDWSEFDRGSLDWAVVRERIAARTGLPSSELQRLMEAIPLHLEPIAGTVQWLENLSKQGVPLYVLSNMPKPYAAYLMARHGFLKHFLTGVFSCDVQQIKPHEDIFETAAERFGLDVSRTVFIDDHPRNIETARSLGWRAVQFVSAAQCAQELADRGWSI